MLTEAPYDDVMAMAKERFGWTNERGLSSVDGLGLLRAFGLGTARIERHWLPGTRPTLRSVLDALPKVGLFALSTGDHWIAVRHGTNHDRVRTHGATRVRCLLDAWPFGD